MKLLKKETLIEEGDFKDSEVWARISSHLEEAIEAIEWPEESDNFIIPPGDNRNGVGPIKEAFVTTLQDKGWKKEARLDIAVHKRPGPIDVVYKLDEEEEHFLKESSHFAVEWETGNISSSHRAINKMIVGLLEGQLKGGVLVLPSGDLYPHVTDRVGNYPELTPYFPVWEAVELDEGILEIFVVEQDGLDEDVPEIDKRTDGRALV